MKVKKFHRGGVLLSLILIFSMILTPCAAFADTANVALMLTVEAAPLDFTVTDSLSMHATQGKTALTIDSLSVTNTGSEDLKVSSIAITPAAGWTVVNASTDFTTADSKNKIAFTAGSHDFSSGAYTPNEKITAGSSTTLQLAGKISEKADLTNATQVASMVLTIEKVTIISFTIDGTSYQAEEGMTWEQWVASGYNTCGAYISTDGYSVRINGRPIIRTGVGYAELSGKIINNASHYLGDLEPE